MQASSEKYQAILLHGADFDLPARKRIARAFSQHYPVRDRLQHYAAWYRWRIWPQNCRSRVQVDLAPDREEKRHARAK